MALFAVELLRTTCEIINLVVNVLKEKYMFRGVSEIEKEIIRNGLRWHNNVDIAENYLAWSEIVSNMFFDGLVNKGRLKVFILYTKDVCKKVDIIEKEKIMRDFSLRLQHLKRQR